MKKVNEVLEEVKPYRPQLEIKFKFIRDIKGIISNLKPDQSINRRNKQISAGLIWAKVVMALLTNDPRIYELINDEKYSADKVDEFFEKV